MCWLRISAVFFAFLKEPLSVRVLEYARHTELIHQAWIASGKVYGFRKPTDDLRNADESIFHLLKRERIRRRTYTTRDAARQDVFDYIEMF
jgi:hypothetical protein